MGWKYTKEIKREEAIQSIINHLDDLNNVELGDVMSSMFGENSKLPHYGANFTVYSDGDLRYDEYGNLREECK